MSIAKTTKMAKKVVCVYQRYVVVNVQRTRPLSCCTTLTADRAGPCLYFPRLSASAHGQCVSSETSISLMDERWTSAGKTRLRDAIPLRRNASAGAEVNLHGCVLR